MASVFGPATQRRVPVPAPAPAPEANPFDQFDAAPAAADASNPFDQFDAAPAPAAAVPIRVGRGGVDPSKAPSSLVDMIMSLGSGVVRGATEMPMLPQTMQRLLDTYATPVELKYAVNPVRAAFGYDPLTPQDVTGGTVVDAMNQGQDAIRQARDSVLHEPQTVAGQYARTVGEFAAPGGMPSKATRMAPTLARKIGEYAADLTGNAVLPALVSETAGQATQGTSYEPWARILGAVAGQGATALGRAWNAPEIAVRRAMGDMTDEQWARAQELQNNPFGIRLTGPEAIAQATGGASALPNLQRVVEGGVEGRAATAPFFAARPAQVDTAVGGVLDKIAPQDANPSTLGTRAASAAEAAIAASPQGQSLEAAIFGAGPRTTPLQAGEAIQPDLRRVYEGREGMRNALSDADFAAARAAPARVPVSVLAAETTVRRPEYTQLNPVQGEKASAIPRNAAPTQEPTTMAPKQVPAQVETPPMVSRTGGAAVQVDPRGVVQFIDKLAQDTGGEAGAALQAVRQSMFTNGGVDTSVARMIGVRGQINDAINAAVNNGQNATAKVLNGVRDQLDKSLTGVPEYARAVKNFEAASRPLDPFTSPGMTKVVARNEFNTAFKTAPEDVTSAIMSPSELKNFNQVASPNARTAMGNRIATDLLDKATDASGNVSVERLALAMRDAQDVLSQFPDVAQRIQSVVDAAGKMADARTGPIGAVAAAKETSAAGNALLPQNPMVGAAKEQGDAVARLAMQDAGTTKSLVRQNLADRYAKASTETQEGNREFAGAKFHKDVAGNAPRAETLAEVLQALPSAPSGEMNSLLDVLAATGRRKQIGSATAFNAASLNNDLGAASPAAALFGLARSLGTNLVTQAADATKRAALRRNVKDLADLFTDPNSVEMLRNTLNKGIDLKLGEALPRAAGQSLMIQGENR